MTTGMQNMAHGTFDAGVQFPDVDPSCGLEPSLREILVHYYRQSMTKEAAESAAQKYIDLAGVEAEVARQPETDEQYADEQALIDHLDSLMDDGGQGGEKWEPAQAAIAGIIAARPPVGEPMAWMTHHDEPMLFPTAAEAAAYCDDDEPPIPLYAAPPAQQTAQAAGLGQFREAIDWAARMCLDSQREAKLIELLALIDSHAEVPNAMPGL